MEQLRCIVERITYQNAENGYSVIKCRAKGFRTADTIASKLGYGHEKYERLRSGILYTLNKLSDEGHCYATREMLIRTGAEKLVPIERTAHRQIQAPLKASSDTSKMNAGTRSAKR